MTEQAKTGPILVPLDGSKLAAQAIAYAQSLAGPGQELIFLAVLPAPGTIRDLWGNVLSTADDVLAMEQEAGRKVLAEIADDWRSVLVGEPRLEVVAGDAAEEILKTAERLGASMIVMASHGRGAIGRVAYGSVADRVTRNAETPVLVIHPEEDGAVAPRQVTRVLVPVDGSEMAMEALPLAIDLAKAAGASVHMVQAIAPAAVVMPSPVGAAYYPPELIDEIEAEMIKDAESSLAVAGHVVEQAGVPVTQAIINGTAASAIESEVKPGDVIVMTSHGRGGFKRWLLGSVSEKLMRSGVAPVVLVPASARVAAMQPSSGKES